MGVLDGIEGPEGDLCLSLLDGGESPARGTACAKTAGRFVDELAGLDDAARVDTMLARTAMTVPCSATRRTGRSG